MEIMEINKSIGERLREVREAMAKSQTEFSEIAAQAAVPGATRQSQAKYEKGLAAPSASYLAAIAKAGADVRYILTGEFEEPPKDALSAEEKLMLEYFRDASPAVRKAALGALLSQSQNLPGGFSQHNVGDNAIQIGGTNGKVNIKRGK